MAINNLNPRRTVWFSPHEPSNKYDIWLSKNAHYDENGEPTTDSNAQRDCDYIFKIYDCGKWNPIVGFNTTAANKINIVEGNTLYHPAIFTGENPNDLYDAGTLGSLLNNPNFVTELEWHDVFNGSNYDWGDIFGDTNWFGDLTWSIILGGSSSYHLPWATTTQCGGILSDIHPNIEGQREAGVQVRFAPLNMNLYDVAYNGLRIPLHHLAITGRQLIYAINEEFSNHPETPGITINKQELAEILLDIFKNSSSLGFEDVWSLANDPHVYPHIWGVNSTNAGKFLRINPIWNPEGTGWSQQNNNMDWVDLKDWFDESSIYDLPIGSAYGINTLKMTIFQGTEYERVAYTHILDHYTTSTGEGKICVTKFYDEGNAFGNKYGLDWVEPNLDFLSDVVINNPSNGLLLLFNGTVWTNGNINTNYTAGAGIDIDIQNNKISLNIELIEEDTPPEVLNVSWTTSRDSIDILGLDYSKSIGLYEYYENNNGCEYTFSLLNNGNLFFNTNPIYLRIVAKTITFTNGTKYICDTLVDNAIPDGEYLVTILFGVIKFEKINTFNNA